MFTTIEAFLQEWKLEADRTQRVLGRLTDNSLEQSITQGHNSLGWLAWHLAGSIPVIISTTGLKVSSPGPQENRPKAAKEIAKAYLHVATELELTVEKNWSDADLDDPVDFFGQRQTKAGILRLIIQHQVHHRGQMTVLMRQANLRVPGLYGPSKEEMEASE